VGAGGPTRGRRHIEPSPGTDERNEGGYDRETQGDHSTRYQLDADSHIAELCYQLEGVTLRRLLDLDGALETADVDVEA
jgi:hypothetical protein